MTPTALIVIDMSYDFVALNGRLTCGQPAIDIVDYVHQKCDKAINEGVMVVFAMDEHKMGVDGEWPKHNDPEDCGCTPYGVLNEFMELYHVHPNFLYVPKTKYNAFWGTPLADLLRQRGVTTVELMGVCTDICVVDTAAGAYYEGFKVKIHQAGVATFSEFGPTSLKMAALKYRTEILE